MTNTSATGGYLKSGAIPALPGNLTLVQFIQSVLVGVSSLPGDMVRPNWQIEPPKPPDILVNWMAFGIQKIKPDVNAYNWEKDDGGEFQRQEEIEIQCHFYGPLAMENAQLVSDGLQIQQNLAALRSANMGFKETTELLSAPDLVNERYRNRYVMSVFLRRQIQRVYPILPILSAHGTIHYVKGDEEYLTNWEVEPLEES